MNDGLVFKAAHDLDHRVGFADGVEELIAHAFALRRTAHQPGDVDKLHAGRNYYFRLDQLRQRREAFIGNRHHADVGLAGREGIVGDQRGRLGRHGVEERRLSDVG